MRKSLAVLLLMVCVSPYLIAQSFTISGEFRPRFEIRHGYRTLPSVGDKTAFLMSQRNRINMMYEGKVFNVFAGFQEVSLWGEKGMFEVEPGLGFHQVYTEVPFLNHFLIKVGRQEIKYNNQRLFGINNWNQRGRAHDAAVMKFSADGWSAHLGAAFNQNSENFFGTFYESLEYKSLNYLWLDKAFGTVNLTAMGVVDGYQDTITKSKSYFRSTYGAILLVKLHEHLIELHAFRQEGKNQDAQNINAWYIHFMALFIPIKKFAITVGAEIFSGHDQKKVETDYRAFNTLYGTRHTLNGHLDYFTDIPKHTKNCGLINPYLKLAYKLSPKIVAKADYHYFALYGNLLKSNGKAIDKFLGTEVDLSLQYAISKSLDLQIGYSTMFASESMEHIKTSGSFAEPIYWGWVMFTVKPLFFSNK